MDQELQRNQKTALDRLDPYIDELATVNERRDEVQLKCTEKHSAYAKTQVDD